MYAANGMGTGCMHAANGAGICLCILLMSLLMSDGVFKQHTFKAVVRRSRCMQEYLLQ